MDPLRCAMNRGSGARKFLNMPLVRDYVQVKFLCTLPHWGSSSPFQSSINAGFYKYRDFDHTNFERSPDSTDRWDAALLRYWKTVLVLCI